MSENASKMQADKSFLISSKIVPFHSFFHLLSKQKQNKPFKKNRFKPLERKCIQNLGDLMCSSSPSTFVVVFTIAFETWKEEINLNSFQFPLKKGALREKPPTTSSVPFERFLFRLSPHKVKSTWTGCQEYATAAAGRCSIHPSFSSIPNESFVIDMYIIATFVPNKWRTPCKWVALSGIIWHFEPFSNKL